MKNIRFFLSFLFLLFSFSIINTSVTASASSYNVPDNAFILKGNDLSVYGYGAKPVKQVILSYDCRVGVNLNYSSTKTITVYNQSPAYYFDVSFTPNFDNNQPFSFPYPYFYSTGLQYGPFLNIKVIYNDNTYTYNQVKLSFATHSASYFTTRDTSFYYYTSDYNSFVDSATGLVTDQICSYNCLSYVLGESGWNINSNFYNTSTVIQAMTQKGYYSYPYSNHTRPQIVAYVNDGSITHFARVTAWDSSNNPTQIVSKWGQLELIHSNGVNPFNSYTGSDSYGHAAFYFY